VKKLKISEATASLADYTRDLQGPLIVTTHGRPVAALVPIKGVDMETLAVGTNPQFLDLIERSRRREQEEGGISSEEIRRRFGLPPFSGRKSKPRGGASNRK
jgi:prevent-host-death family protein